MGSGGCGTYDSSGYSATSVRLMQGYLLRLTDAVSSSPWCIDESRG